MHFVHDKSIFHVQARSKWNLKNSRRVSFYEHVEHFTPNNFATSMPKYGHRRKIPLPPGMYDARSPVELSAKIQKDCKRLSVHFSLRQKPRTFMHFLNYAYPTLLYYLFFNWRRSTFLFGIKVLIKTARIIFKSG